jgi:hypothetical protein
MYMYIRSGADRRVCSFHLSSRFDHKIIRTGCVKSLLLLKMTYIKKYIYSRRLLSYVDIVMLSTVKEFKFSAHVRLFKAELIPYMEKRNPPN